MISKILGYFKSVVPDEINNKFELASYLNNMINKLNEVVNSTNKILVNQNENTSVVEKAKKLVPELNELNETFGNEARVIKSQLAEKTTKGQVSVLDINKNLGKLDQTYFTDEFIQQMAGTTPVNAVVAPSGISKLNIVDRAIDARKTDFFALSNNLFNKADVTPGFSINSTTGELVANATFNASNFIEVKPSTAYIMANVGRYALYDKNFNFISSATTAAFTTTANTYYVRIAVSMASLVVAQLNEGDTLPAYDEYKAELKRNNNGLKIVPSTKTILNDALLKDSVTPFNLSMFKKSNNIFNKHDVIQGSTLTPNTGVITQDTTYSLGSDYIAVEPNTTYNKGAANITVCLYDIDKQYITGYIRGTDTPTFTTPSSCHYIRVAVKNIYLDSLMLSVGETALPYEDFIYTLQSTSKYPLIISSEHASAYPTMRPYRNYNYDKGTYASVVASLNNTGCVVENLGLSSDGVRNIYGLSYGDTATKPVIFIVSNQHGSEWQAVHYCLDFMKSLSGVNRFYDTELLKTLKDNFAFYLIVSANPWGYDNSSYVNYNGVNLNRNWDKNWTNTASGEGTNQYKGTAPFSEVDLQRVRDKFNSLQPYMLIDCHTTGETPGGIDTGKFYTAYRDLLFNCHKEILNIFNDAQLYTQEWNTGSSSTSVGWSGLQNSKEGSACIPTIIEHDTKFSGNYGLTTLFMLCLFARDRYLNN